MHSLQNQNVAKCSVGILMVLENAFNIPALGPSESTAHHQIAFLRILQLWQNRFL